MGDKNLVVDDYWTHIRALERKVRRLSQRLLLPDEWVSYTPVWTASTTNPTIGNGSLTGAYFEFGTILFVRARVLAGSTTTFGSGAYSLSLPPGYVSPGLQTVAVFLRDSSAAVRWGGAAMVVSGGTTFDRIFVSDGTVGVTNTNPFTWASGDDMVVQGAIEVDPT